MASIPEMRLGVLLLRAALAAANAAEQSDVLHFDIRDARGKKASGVTIEPGIPDADGWRPVKLARAKGDAVLVWPFDSMAAAPGGPGPIPAIVIVPGDEKALANPLVAAAIATPVVLGVSSIDEAARQTRLSSAALSKAFEDLASSKDAFLQGVGLLYAGRFPEAADELSRALKDRQRQLTPVPSEIYPAAMLYAKALMLANRFEEASVAYLMALRQRRSDAAALRGRRDALIKAGKPEAAEQLQRG